MLNRFLKFTTASSKSSIDPGQRLSYSLSNLDACRSKLFAIMNEFSVNTKNIWLSLTNNKQKYNLDDLSVTHIHVF